MRVFAVIAVAALAMSCTTVEEPVEAVSQPIIDGDSTTDYPAVGQLFAGGMCTATLIGCSTVLTAGHCVCPEGDVNCTNPSSPGNVQFFLQHRGFYQASEVLVHPDYGQPNGNLSSDIAVIKLETPVLGVAPMAMVQSRPNVGAAMTIVGYGRVDGLNDYEVGVKRAGTSAVSNCGGPESNTLHQCRIGGDKTCQGDSGGPAFEGVGPAARVAGITSYGYGNFNGELIDCSGEKVSAQVDTFRGWIEDQAGVDLGTDACGTFPPIGDGAIETSAGGAMDEGDVLELSIEVPKGTSELHLNWNGYTGYMDGTTLTGIKFFMSLTEGRPEGTDELIFNVCSGDATSCVARSPASGTWTARFRLEEGSTESQLVAAAYGDAPIAEPDNYRVEEDHFIRPNAADGLLRNDSASSRGGEAVLVRGPENGQLNLRSDGSFDYQPVEDFTGADTFTYRTDDGVYTSEETTVTLEIVSASGCGCRASGLPSSSWVLLLGLFALRRRRRRFE